MPDLDEYEVALLVASVLDELGIEYALGGSLASSLQGEPRATNDVDFAVRLEDHHVSPLVERLGPDFVIDVDGLRKAVRLGRSHQIYFLPLVLKIDLFVRGATPFDRKWRDILGILRVSATDLDRSYLAQWAQPLNVRDLLIQAFDQA